MPSPIDRHRAHHRLHATCAECPKRADSRAGFVLRSALLVMVLGIALTSSRVSAEPLNSTRATEISQASDEGDSNPKIEEAKRKFQNRDFKGALEACKEAAASNPEFGPGQILYSQLCFQSNQIAMARAALEQAAVELPGDPDAFAAFGELAYRQKRMAEASLLFEKSLALSQAFEGNEKRKKTALSRSHAGVAAVHQARGQWEEAYEHLKEWLKLDPGNAVAHTRLGQVLFNLKKYDEAYQSLSTAAKADPKSISPDITMASLISGEIDRYHDGQPVRGRVGSENGPTVAGQRHQAEAERSAHAPLS